MASLWVQKGEKRIKDEATFGRNSTTPTNFIIYFIFHLFPEEKFKFYLKGTN